jgi:hypothetical protein
MGTSSYGVGTPSTAPVPGGRIFRNTKTGGALDARKIDPTTRQYELDDYGRVLGMSGVAQRVQLALQTDLGSAALTDLGSDLRKIESFTDNHSQQVDTAIRRALGSLVTEKLIRVDSIAVDRFSRNGAFITVRWVDLVTNTEEETTL